MNTNRELKRVAAYLERPHPDPDSACKVAALQLTIVIKRRRFRRWKNRLLLEAVEAAEAKRA